MKSVEVFERGYAQGFTFRHIRRAGADIGASPRKEGKTAGWVWELPHAAAGIAVEVEDGGKNAV